MYDVLSWQLGTGGMYWGYTTSRGFEGMLASSCSSVLSSQFMHFSCDSFARLVPDWLVHENADFSLQAPSLRVCSVSECEGMEWNHSIPLSRNRSIPVFGLDKKLSRNRSIPVFGFGMG